MMEAFNADFLERRLSVFGSDNLLKPNHRYLVKNNYGSVRLCDECQSDIQMAEG